METLKLKYEVAKKSLESLNRLLNLREQEQKISFCEFVTEEMKKEMFLALRDSLIQRFEYSVDTLWKYIKEYLTTKKGIIQTHPKPIFRECFKAKLASEKEIEDLIRMIDSRNITSHAYKESIAEEISNKIPTYYKLMKKLLDVSKP